MTFLASDKTDEIPYSYPNFVCHNFSVTLREDANKQGFRCAIAQVYYVPIKNDQEVFYAHAFNTTDRGLIYIEPQNYQQYLITNQWQHWPCTVDPYSPNLTLDACSRALFLLYRVVLIW
jgi:hypothetical protein